MFFNRKINPLRLILSLVPLEFIDVDGGLIKRFKTHYKIAGIKNPSDELVAETLVLLQENDYIDIDHPNESIFRIKRKATI